MPAEPTDAVLPDAAEPTAAVLPQSLEAVLMGITAAIHPATHSALPPDLQTTRVARLATIAAFEYAPAAPLEVLAEAAIRMGAWLIGSAPHAREKQVTYPDGTSRNVSINVGMTASAIRHSGASALLAPYRVVRGFEGF